MTVGQGTTFEGRMSSSDEDDESQQGPRERGASYAGSKTLELLGELGSAKHAGRIKALKRFQEYINKYKPELYDDDVELLYVGSSTLVGLIPWCGQKAQKGDALKTTSKSVLQLVLWLVSLKAEDMGGENLFLEKLLELREEDLKKMQLSMHIRSSDDSEAFELLFLLLSRHKSSDGQSEALDLDVLLPDEEARRKFTRWLQQSATEHQLMDRIEMTRNTKVAAAAAAAAQSSGGGSRPPALSRADGQGGRSGGGVLKSVDPLGLNNMDLVSAEQARAQAAVVQGGPPSARRGSASIVTAKERINLLQKLQQAPFGGGGGGGGSSSSSQKKYTRNRARAVRVQADVGRQATAGASIVPQEEGFDPIFFLTVVHGHSSFADLKRGQENLEGAMGTQANQLQQLVREHYDNFVSCADGIHWFKNMIAEESMAKGSSSSSSSGAEASRVAKLLTIVTETKEGARKLFSPLLERMDKTRSLRSARLMLQRLAKVLDVPGRMAKSMKAGHYDDVVREYERVKALPLGGGVHLLVRVQEQAEMVAKELRDKLQHYVATDPHNAEDLVEAADLLNRLGQVPEPLLHCFVKQAELFGKGLDGWDEWYAKGLEATVQRRQGGVLDQGDWDDEDDDDDEEEDDDEESKGGGGDKESKRRFSVLQSPDGAEDEPSDDDSEFSMDDEDREDGGKGGGANNKDLFSTGFALNSVEHEAASLRLNYVRKLVREAARFIPTLIRLSGVVTEELSAVKVVWEAGQYTFRAVRGSDHDNTSSSSANKPRSSSILPSGGDDRDAVPAPRAVMDHVMAAVQRICKTCRLAMFGASHSDGLMGQPLEAAYFREALRAVAGLYELMFNQDGDDGVTKAVLPPLKVLLEDSQKKQTQSVLERLAAEVLKLPSSEDWLLVVEGGPGTRLPEHFCHLVHNALEELASQLLRPFWCANQVAAGLSTCVTNVLRSLEALSVAEDVPMPASSKLLKCPPQDLRLLALMGNCIQLDRKYIPRLVEETAALFEVESELTYSAAILSVHDAMLHAYLEKKASDIEAALRAGWVLKLKGIKTSFLQGLPVPGYLIQVLMILIRIKTEVKDALGDLPLLVDFSSEVDSGDASSTYVETAMAATTQSTYTTLIKRLNQLLVVLETQKKRGGPYGEVAHMTLMEAEFLINTSLKPHLSASVLQSCRSPLTMLKALAADGLGDDEETDTVLEYTTKYLADVAKMYVASLEKSE